MNPVSSSAFSAVNRSLISRISSGTGDVSSDGSVRAAPDAQEARNRLKACLVAQAAKIPFHLVVDRDGYSRTRAEA